MIILLSCLAITDDNKMVRFEHLSFDKGDLNVQGMKHLHVHGRNEVVDNIQ
jgi:hypothetical protein